MEAININQLSMSYNGHQVLKSVNAKIEQGKVVALLGRNGAGKTTTFPCSILALTDLST
jgi:ABC-type multidrug transport system ATPase subunit